jgi:large subunit ribosomal protein L17
MRHRVQFRRLNRTAEHRWALRRNMAQSLFEHGSITTTLPKAKNIQPFAERLLTFAIKAHKARQAGQAFDELAARRSIEQLMGDRVVVPAEHRADYEGMSDAAREKTLRMPSGRRHRTGEAKGRLAFTADSVTRRLIERIAPNYVERPGGYTRIIRTASRRIGDGSQLAVLQLVGNEQSPGSLSKPDKGARRRKADARYGLAIKISKKKTDGPARRDTAKVENEGGSEAQE